jgi:hypothetical protein
MATSSDARSRMSPRTTSTPDSRSFKHSYVHTYMLVRCQSYFRSSPTM